MGDKQRIGQRQTKNRTETNKEWDRDKQRMGLRQTKYRTETNKEWD